MLENLDPRTRTALALERTERLREVMLATKRERKDSRDGGRLCEPARAGRSRPAAVLTALRRV